MRKNEKKFSINLTIRYLWYGASRLERGAKDTLIEKAAIRIGRDSNYLWKSRQADRQWRKVTRYQWIHRQNWRARTGVNSRFGIRIDRLGTAVRSSNQILFVGGPRSNPSAWKIEGSQLYVYIRLACAYGTKGRTRCFRFTFSFLVSFHQNFSTLFSPFSSFFQFCFHL